MKNQFDIIIVGGGVIGCSIAYHLSLQRLKILVVEKKSVGAQASGGSPGMLAAQEECTEPGHFFDVCVASRELFSSLVPEVRQISGIDPEWTTGGIWRLADSEAERDRLFEIKKWQENEGHSAVPR